ncbi:choice-of-anchor D domain-containing protein [Haloferula sp.]|uniref:choice-of-anchor D domain-containing protein n=1 Tax=Haloferula sp. TaxID=2497595 RepID=UPI00329B61D1
MMKNYAKLLMPVMAFMAINLQAGTVTWRNDTGDGLWTTAANWDTGSIPADGDTVIINNGDSVDTEGLAGPLDGQLPNGSRVYVSGGSTLKGSPIDMGYNGASIYVASDGILQASTLINREGLVSFEDGAQLFASTWQQRGSFGSDYTFKLGTSGFSTLNGGQFQLAGFQDGNLDRNDYVVDMSDYRGGTGVITLVDFSNDLFGMSNTLFQASDLEVVGDLYYTANLQWNDTTEAIELNITSAPALGFLFEDAFAFQRTSPDLEVANGGVFYGSNVGATKETGEPDHVSSGGSSVWYRWTAPYTGNATFDTVGSNFDTLLAVYTGDSVAALNPVGSNDNIDGVTNQQSRVSFTAVAGTVYRIAVDGYNDGGGAASGDVTLNYVLNYADIQLVGNGEMISNGDTTPDPTDHTDFGSANVSSGSEVRTFTIANMGSVDLTLDGSPRVVVSGPHASEFTVTVQPSALIASGGTTTFQVTFDPSLNGTRSATLIIASNDADHSPYEFAVQGCGLAPEINLVGNGLSITNGDDTPDLSDHTDFDNTVANSGSVVRTFTIENTGVLALSLTGDPRVSIEGAHAEDFTVNIQPAASISAASSATFQVTFNPSAGGPRLATLSIASDDVDEPLYDFSIMGYGLSSALDFDDDGMSDLGEYQLSALGFDWQNGGADQEALVSTYFSTAGTNGLFTTSQVQAIHVGTPLLSRNESTGIFMLTMDLKKSINLSDFSDFPATAPAVSVNPQGGIQFEFESSNNAAFFRIEVE